MRSGCADEGQTLRAASAPLVWNTFSCRSPLPHAPSSAGRKPGGALTQSATPVEVHLSDKVT